MTNCHCATDDCAANCPAVALCFPGFVRHAARGFTTRPLHETFSAPARHFDAFIEAPAEQARRAEHLLCANA